MCTLKLVLTILLAIMLLAACALASDVTVRDQPVAPLGAEAVIEHIFAREKQFVEAMKNYSPVVETYIQNLKPDRDLGEVPESDKYFIGRLMAGNAVRNLSYDSKPGIRSRFISTLTTVFKMDYIAQGFMQLIFLDTSRFNGQNYDLRYLRREFLGAVRCMVFDVVPRPGLRGVHFLGRIWVEDQDDTIVRLNGTYVPSPHFRYYFHFDSWRVNTRPGIWVPAYVYTEETDRKYSGFRRLSMKGQTRLWGYDLKNGGKQEEFTNITVDSPNSEIADRSEAAANEISPLASERLWERQAEDNILERLERAGVMAPNGEVSKILETVVNNLILTNNLSFEPQVRCRVLLTTPLESFTIGHTIVVSRGLLDVLPDEPALATVLAHELAHIALAHQTDTKYAFADRTFFPDEQTFRRFALRRNPEEENTADQKAVELLKNSPYSNQLANAGLFLRALQAHSAELSYLISPHFGNRLAQANEIMRMASVMNSAPQLQPGDPKQLAALPLGGRVKVDAWDDHLELQKGKPLPVLTPRDKMSFEVTPMFPNLVRYKAPKQLASVQGK